MAVFPWILAATTLLPLALGFSAGVYALAAIWLNTGFLRRRVWQLYRQPSDALAKALFRYSIHYLAWLFAALLLDHYCQRLPWF
ncbi:hypothetical protein [Deefgea sp. CFH1-16]|uniref:hypothetical protein n=1 Tax=Deefgea sp. CFH1-16 TaxID=2675457 RepID=UPI001FFC3D84|nr:hypothetical protein [Deefgea sp. CFH1-16]